MSTVHPTTEVGRAIQSIYETTTWIVLGILVVVEALLVVAVVKFRRKEGQEGLPEQIHGNTALEVGWTLIPLVFIVIVMVPTLQTTCALQQPAPGEDPLRVTVTGKRWWWEFEYVDEGIVTANELHLPVGRMVDLTLISDNIIHSFWVPRLAGKRDLVPSRSQHLWFTPERTGWYEGQCAELCGSSHALMQLLVKVETPAEFDAWVAAQKAPAQIDMANPGVQAFVQNACFTCHSIEGSPWTFARIGPNLTHVASRTRLAGAILENTPENMKRWIRNAADVKPGHASKVRQEPDLMWNFEHVSEEQLDALVAFLQSLD
jgi:cytochrome c oxidase subunit 2